MIASNICHMCTSFMKCAMMKVQGCQLTIFHVQLVDSKRESNRMSHSTNHGTIRVPMAEVSQLNQSSSITVKQERLVQYASSLYDTVSACNATTRWSEGMLGPVC